MVNEMQSDNLLIKEVIQEIEAGNPEAIKTGKKILEELMQDAEIETNEGKTLTKFSLIFMKKEKLIELLKEAEKALKELIEKGEENEETKNTN